MAIRHSFPPKQDFWTQRAQGRRKAESPVELEVARHVGGEVKAMSHESIDE